MTIAPCLAGVNAAHEPRPANGCICMPSTFTFTSVRGQPMRTTPSFVVVAFAPDASAIFSASSAFAFGASSARASNSQPAPARTAASVAPDNSHVIFFMELSSCWGPGRGGLVAATGHSHDSGRPAVRSLAQVGDLEAVEVGAGVGLRPQADL